WQEAVEKLMDILDSITLDGCVFTSDSFRAAYLMDNAEVYEGCRDISEFLSERSENGHAELAGRYSALADKIQAAVEEKFWDSESNAYHIGVSKSGSPIRFQSFEEFYPDAVAQLYPAICRMRTVGSRELELYQGLCAAHAWEKGELSGHTFEWSLLAYAAFVHGDTESLNQYLSYYEKKAAASRDYPMHTANAGWVMLAAGEQSEVLKAELREGFFTYLFSGNWFGESR
ncbi:MAG: hypothetical protein ACSW8H_08855, partial [bacterium]